MTPNPTQANPPTPPDDLRQLHEAIVSLGRQIAECNRSIACVDAKAREIREHLVGTLEKRGLTVRVEDIEQQLEDDRKRRDRHGYFALAALASATASLAATIARWILGLSSGSS